MISVYVLSGRVSGDHYVPGCTSDSYGLSESTLEWRLSSENTLYAPLEKTCYEPYDLHFILVYWPNNVAALSSDD